MHNNCIGAKTERLMCGIYGMVSLDGAPLRYPQVAGRMAKSLHHRGPDGNGVWENADAIVGATRLRIIDRRTSSDQPFVGPDGTVLVCNGEIYNAGDIRNRFPNYRYRSRTDVEPLVPLLEKDGVAGLTAMDGMFAIAAWNTHSRCLRLVRDRAGEKPLFYCKLENEVWFASEIQALRNHPLVEGGLNRLAIADYLALGYVREPRTLHPQIHKVPASTVIEFTAQHSASHTLDQHNHPRPTFSSNPDRLRSLLQLAVTKQLHADVPVGVFISGGLDSSMVTAFATQTQPGIRTFTVRFTDTGYDEGVFARRVAAHFRTRHHEVVASTPKLLTALNIATSKISEPVSDPAILPTILLAQLARNHVGVVLNGEGSDELFGGYPTYIGHQWAGAASRLPRWCVELIRAGLATGAASSNRVPLTMLLDRFFAFAREDTNRRHVSWFGTGLLGYLPSEFQTHVLKVRSPHVDAVTAAMDLDFSGYLREGLLTKLDRAAMFSSLETRAPFLDKNVISYATSLPRNEKVQGLKLKIALAAAARDIVPSWVIRRRKRGLSVPVGRWINGALAPLVDRLLEPKRIANQTFMPDLPVGRLVAEHRRGEANHSRALWALIVLQLWVDHWEGT